MATWPQWTILALLFIRVIAVLVKDAKKTGIADWERATDVIATFVIFGAEVAVLWAGGFWTPLLGG